MYVLFVDYEDTSFGFCLLCIRGGQCFWGIWHGSKSKKVELLKHGFIIGVAYAFSRCMVGPMMWINVGRII